MRSLLLTVAIAAVGALAGSAGAAPPTDSDRRPDPPVAVSVSLGPALQARSGDLGQSDLDALAASLHDAVVQALRRPRSPPPLSVSLVLEDVRPNRPTIAEQSEETSLSIASKSLGGARISGVVTYPGGFTRPLREQFYQTDLANVQGFDRWQDADRAIEQTAVDLARGRFPAAYDGPGPTGPVGFLKR